jgi:hypothetical protein
MEKNAVIPKEHELLVFPHMGMQLLELFAGTWRPASTELETLAAHLMTCSACRLFLLTEIAMEQGDRNAKRSHIAITQDLLTRFLTIHYRAEAPDYEDLGAYAETVLAQGEGEANTQFPLLGMHLSLCKTCKSTIDATIAFLNETKESS